MGYYTRVLTTANTCVPIAAIRENLRKKGHNAVIQSDTDEGEWEQITLAHPDGIEIAAIERNVVEPGSLGEEEIGEFNAELNDALPKTGAAWLRDFFSRVRCIYAFQHLSGTEKGDGFAALNTVREKIWNAAPAVLQADLEGFSNEAGYHILWQFSETATGDWWMGVLKDGKWAHFQMDLGNPVHRAAFKRGEIPKGVKLA